MGDASDSGSVPLAKLLWQRIRQLGVEHVMGVPGDMNLELLDYIDEVEGLRWVGNANELNAAYAADGYCRVKGTPGVIVTTFGVGELSAINGIAGAYTEQVKVIHIVGTTPTVAQDMRLMIHHCLGPSPDHRVYEKISTPVRATQCRLDDIKTAPQEIDRVIRECHLQSLPVYIFVPMDFVHQRVPASLLEASVNLAPDVDDGTEQAALTAVLERVHAAKKPTIIVDCLIARQNASPLARQLAEKLQWPTFATPMGKSIIDEGKDYYYGIYNGSLSQAHVLKTVEQSDLVLDLGPLWSDSNTGGFSREIPENTCISVSPKEVKVGGQTFAVPLVPFLTKLLASIDQSKLSTWKAEPVPSPELSSDNSNKITQKWLWPRIGRFLRNDDVLVVDSGTAQFGMPDATFPDITYITQLYFGSIGYSVPACLGAALARKEEGGHGRIVLVVGDGSLQLTAQEIGTMVRMKLDIIIFLINNDGYTIERAIHGPEQGYNDINPWNHTHLLSLFGHANGQENTHAAHTEAELEALMASSSLVGPEGKGVQVVEIFTGKMDIPRILAQQIELVQGRNRKAAEAAKQREKQIPAAS